MLDQTAPRGLLRGLTLVRGVPAAWTVHFITGFALLDLAYSVLVLVSLLPAPALGRSLSILHLARGRDSRCLHGPTPTPPESTEGERRADLPGKVPPGTRGWACPPRPPWETVLLSSANLCTDF